MSGCFTESVSLASISRLSTPVLSVSLSDSLKSGKVIFLDIVDWFPGFSLVLPETSLTLLSATVACKLPFLFDFQPHSFLW